jgi:hypothetical protein
VTAQTAATLSFWPNATIILLSLIIVIFIVERLYSKRQWLLKIKLGETPPIVVFLGLIISGVVFCMPSIHGVWGYFGAFAKEVGFAFMVSGIVGMSIEWYNIKRHKENQEKTERRYDDLSKKLQLDVFDAIYERRLSPSILDAIKRYILASPFICVRFSINIVLAAIANDRVLMSAKVVREVKNVSGKTEPLEIFHAFIRKCLENKSPYRTDFNMMKCNDEIFFGESLISKSGKTEDGRDCVSYTISTEPESITRMELEFESEMNMKDHFPISIKMATDKLTISVRHDPSLIIDLTEFHKTLLIKEPRISSSLDSMYRIRGGLLPGNGVLLAWRQAET